MADSSDDEFSEDSDDRARKAAKTGGGAQKQGQAGKKKPELAIDKYMK